MPDGAPKDIRVQALNHSAISVRWKEPTEKSGRIRGYFVYYLHVKDDFQIFPHKTLPDFYDTDSSLDRVSSLFSLFLSSSRTEKNWCKTGNSHLRPCLRERSSGCSESIGIARAIQDLCIQNAEFLVVGACQMSHLG